MTNLIRHSNNQTVTLTKEIANSGEGKVWETNLSGYLAKIYHDPTPARIEKLTVMLVNPPLDPMLSHNHVSIAWVSDLLKDSSGKYLGFLMPAINNSKQLSSICNPKSRKKNAPNFNWYYLHVTALNTAWIIQEIHAKDYVLGDIKLENILVNDRAMTAVIDTDSFQVRDFQSNKVYRCTVGSEGFTPPELLGKDFNTINQTEIHDRFRLGVLIHYLLFGYHPFSALGQNWTGVGRDSPEQTELIKQGYWYGGHNSPIRESENTISLSVVHPELKKLFLQCFNDGHTQPHIRPSARDWHNALEVAVNQLTSCSRVDSHYYSRHYSRCYWCDRAADLDVDIFPKSRDKIGVYINTHDYQKNTLSSSNISNSASLKSTYDSNLLFKNTLEAIYQSFCLGFTAGIIGTLVGLIAGIAIAIPTGTIFAVAVLPFFGIIGLGAMAGSQCMESSQKMNIFIRLLVGAIVGFGNFIIFSSLFILIVMFGSQEKMSLNEFAILVITGSFIGAFIGIVCSVIHQIQEKKYD
jgi:serine/threonine protein kinase